MFGFIHDVVVNGDTGSGNQKGSEGVRDSGDLRESLKELQEKLAALPANLEHAYQRVLERVMAEFSSASSSSGDPGGKAEKSEKSGKLSQKEHLPESIQKASVVHAKTPPKIPLATSAENGFEELQLRNGGDGLQDHGKSLPLVCFFYLIRCLQPPITAFCAMLMTFFVHLPLQYLDESI